MKQALDRNSRITIRYYNTAVWDVTDVDEDPTVRRIVHDEIAKFQHALLNELAKYSPANDNAGSAHGSMDDWVTHTGIGPERFRRNSRLRAPYYKATNFSERILIGSLQYKTSEVQAFRQHMWLLSHVFYQLRYKDEKVFTLRSSNQSTEYVDLVYTWLTGADLDAACLAVSIWLVVDNGAHWKVPRWPLPAWARYDDQLTAYTKPLCPAVAAFRVLRRFPVLGDLWRANANNSISTVIADAAGPDAITAYLAVRVDQRAANGATAAAAMAALGWPASVVAAADDIVVGAARVFGPRPADCPADDEWFARVRVVALVAEVIGPAAALDAWRSCAVRQHA